ILLLGWAEAGPRILRQLHLLHTTVGGRQAGQGPQCPTPEADGADTGPGGRTESLPEEMSLLARAQRIDDEHRRDYGRPVAADTLRRHLGVGSARARSLVRQLRATSRREEPR